MYGEKFCIAPFVLIDRSGKTSRFGSLYRLCDKLVAQHEGADITTLVGSDLDEHPYLVRAGNGALLDGVQLAVMLAYRRGRSGQRTCRRGRYRDGVWPGTARRRCHRGSWCRRMATKGILTNQAAADPDLAEIGWVRPDRRRDVPDYRDDVPRHRERCWKRHRANQYK